MYFPNVVSLKQFYASALGNLACAFIGRRLKALWPESPGEAVLGLGYATPYFPYVSGERDVAVAAMPAVQGALYWPQGEKNRVCLTGDAQLPFADASFNRVIIVHTLEHSDHLTAMMQEIWRILTPGGRMLAVAPNRLGLWSHSGISPFGYGRPFSVGQMREAAAAGGLTLTRADYALFVPPVNTRWVLRAAAWFEFLGRLICPHQGGVLCVEAEKQIYAALKEPVKARGKMAVSPIPAMQPAFTPQ